VYLHVVNIFLDSFCNITVSTIMQMTYRMCQKHLMDF